MSPQPDRFVVDGGALSIADVERVARARVKVALGDNARARITASNQALHDVLATGNVIYGVNTGFGSLAQQRISGQQLRELQINLLLSHSAGVGQPLPEEVVRAMMFVLMASLSRGLSGVRLVLVEHIAELLNNEITPVVPSIGSVGASGDLAPLAHAALVLIGKGEAFHRGKRITGEEALRAAKLTPIDLEAKEGLALINGTHLMSALAALALADVNRVFSAAVCAAAMSIDACRGTDAFLDDRVHAARGQSGQSEVARRLAALIKGSEIIPSHLLNDPRVQDPYSLRCSPQVLGAVLDTIHFAQKIVENELGAVTDNPLVFPKDSQHAHQHASAGNFHGMPLAIALDSLAIALAHIAGIAERRIYYILAASDAENHLNPQLSPVPGLHSGLMITQYVAAACCNELISLAAPASVSNIPTNAGMEDYNSFGAASALKARRAVERVTHVISIELLCAAEALEYQRPLRSGPGVEAAFSTVREVVSKIRADHPPSPDIARIEKLILDGCFNDLFAS